MREFFDFLPLSNKEKPPVRRCDDPVDRMVPSLNNIVPSDPTKAYDIKEVIQKVHSISLGALLLA